MGKLLAILLTRIFHELPARGRKDGLATGQPQGLESLTVRRRVNLSLACRSKARGRAASCSESLQLGEKDAHIRGHSR
jgi:hypothetical protein